MASRKNTAKKAAAKKTVAAPVAAPENAPETAPKSTAKNAAKSTAKSTASTAQKPLATGDVEQFPAHTFRADMGEGLPPQKDQLNPDRAK